MGDPYRRNGEEFWSAAEEFCSCQGDEEEEDGDEFEFWTCSDVGDDDDDDEYYSICSPFDPNKDNGLGGDMKNAETQYYFEHSSGSGDEKPRKQYTSQNDASDLELEWYLQSTRTQAIKDSICLEKSKHLQEGTSDEYRKSGSLENTMRSSSLENREVVRNGGVSTKRVGLVLGNRKLTSEIGPSLSEYDDHSELQNQQKGKSTVLSKYDPRESDKRGEKTLETHQVYAQYAPQQSEQFAAGRRDTQSLSYKYEKPTKKGEQEKSINNEKRKDVSELSNDQLDAKTPLKGENPQEDLPLSHLRDDDKRRRLPLDSSSLNAQGSVEETEDLMILVLSTVPDEHESIEDTDAKMDTSFATKKSSSTQWQTYTQQAESEGDQQRNQTLKTTQKSLGKLEEGTQSLSHHSHRPTPNAVTDTTDKERHFDTDAKEKLRDNGEGNSFHGSKYAHIPYEKSNGRRFQGKEVQENDLQSNHFTNDDENRNGNLSFLKEDVRLNELSAKQLRNDAKRRKLLNQTRKNFKGKLDNTKECKPLIQTNHETYDQIPSIQSKILKLSSPSDGGKADTVATNTSKDSSIIRGDKASPQHYYRETQKADVEKREKLLYTPNQNSAHNWKSPHESSWYQSGGKNFSTEDAQNEQIKQSRKGNENGSQRKDRTGNVGPSIRFSFQKPSYSLSGTEKKLDDHTQISRQRHTQKTQKADIKYLDGSILAPLDNISTNLRNDETDGTPPLIRRIRNFERQTQTLYGERRTQKLSIRHPNKFPCFPQNEQTMIRTDQNYQRKLDDTCEKRKQPYQLKGTDLAKSMRPPSQEGSDVHAGMDGAKMDTTSATNTSVSIRGNMELSGVGSQKKYFYDMWMKGKFCDVKIVVDGHSFLAHRVVLAASSEYFDKFFMNSPARTNDADFLTVYVTDMSEDVFRVILKFMYTGHIDIQFGQISQLLKASLFFSMKSLMDALQDFLLNTWKEECIGAFCLAQTAGLHDLHKVILNYIQTHFIEVSTSENFALCPAEHASSILSDDKLLINEEADVLCAVLLWLEHHTRDISSNLRLLRHVRFEYIPTVTLDRIEKSCLNSIANESVKLYIQDARKRTSCLEVHQLHFDPPIIRQRIAEVVGCRTSRTREFESIESTKSYRSSKTSVKKECISPPKVEQPSSHSESEWSVSPSSSKSRHSKITKAVPFPSYHEIDTTSIRVSVSKDVSTSPVASKDDLGETAESAEDESSVQVVRIGGISRTWKEDSVHSDIEKLENRHGKRWEEWTSFAELPVAMHHHAACYIHNSIYISGGHVQLPCDASSNHFKPSRFFHVYDLLKRKWYRLADLENARVFHQMVALFGQIYVIGGQGHDGGALATVERYSPYTDSWRRVAPLSLPRYATAAAVYNFHLWVAGGATNHVTSPNTEAGQQSGQQSGDERAASVYDGFYRSASTFLTGIVECYSPHDNSWTKISDLPTPRCHASLLRINKRLFLVGGFTSIRHFPTDDNSTSSIDVYDDVTESWRYVTDVGEGNYSANTVIVGTKIVILGKPGPLLESDGDIISIFDTSTNKWELRRSRLLEARVGHACCAIPLSTHLKLYQP